MSPLVVKMSLANPPSRLPRFNSSGGECRKRRRPCPGARSGGTPSRHPQAGARRGQPQLPQPGLHQPPIAGASQIARAGALPHRPCTAGSTGMHLLERFRLWPYPRSLEGGGMLSRTKAPGPWGARRARTVCSAGAGSTLRCTAGQADRRVAVSLWALHPHDAPLPLRAERGFGGPGKHEAGRRGAVPRRALPTLVLRYRANPVDPGRGPTRQAGVGGHLARRNQRFPRCQLVGGQGRLHGR
jgi:hypothetical protein